MLTVEEYRSGFLSYLENFESPTNPKNLYEPVSYILDLKGKRIRPILTLLTCDIFNGNYSEALDAALAVEVFHNFSLVHDDIMDEAHLRRGNQTVHKKWDLSTAILSGDVMLILAYQLFENYKGETFVSLAKLFSKTAIEVCEGQQMDIDFSKKDDVTADDYLKMIEYNKGRHYTWQSDFNPGTFSLRKLVAIIQLTDPSEYEGGEVQFAFQDENKDWYEMEKKKGSIINAAIGGGKAPNARSLPTSVTRAAGLNLTKSLANEYASFNIRVNAICIGLIKSAQWERKAKNEDIQNFYKELAKKVPMQKVGEEIDYANLVAFLSSKRSAYITGTAINLDGGLCPVV